MTSQERMELMKKFEKAWYKSKKFLAYLLLMALLSAFVFSAIKFQFNFGWPLATVICVIVFAMGFATLAFNGKQALLDEWTRGIALTGRIPTALAGRFDEMRGVDPAPDDETLSDD